MSLTIEEGSIAVSRKQDEVTIFYTGVYLNVPSIVFSFMPSESSSPVPKWHVSSANKTSCVLVSSAGSHDANFGTIYYKIIERK